MRKQFNLFDNEIRPDQNKAKAPGKHIILFKQGQTEFEYQTLSGKVCTIERKGDKFKIIFEGKETYPHTKNGVKWFLKTH